MSNLVHGWQHILWIIFFQSPENPTGNSTKVTVWQLIDRLHSSFIHPKRHDVTKMASSLSQIRLGNYENVTHTKTPLIYTTRLQNGAKSHIHLLSSIFIQFFHCSCQLLVTPPQTNNESILLGKNIEWFSSFVSLSIWEWHVILIQIGSLYYEIHIMLPKSGE